MAHHQHSRSEQDLQHELATFSDRVAAFGIDLGVFALGYLVTLKLAFPKYSPFSNPHESVWLLAWTALFLLAQAYLSAEGRVSLGKGLVGIRVVSPHGEPLSIGQATVRSLSYLPSSLLNLGFLWVLFNPARQGWHDMAVGSLVIETRRRSPLERAGLRALAGGIIAVIGANWYWNHIAQPRYERIMDVAYARVGLDELQRLQEIHKLLNGRYAKDLDALAKVSGEPEVFKRDMSRLFDKQAGVKIEADSKGYRITAYATDVNRTLVAAHGPTPELTQ